MGEVLDALGFVEDEGLLEELEVGDFIFELHLALLQIVNLHLRAHLVG